MHGRQEGIVETGSSRIGGFPAVIVYHRKNGETAAYAFAGKNNDIGSMVGHLFVLLSLILIPIVPVL
jgi:hypothetical protein